MPSAAQHALRERARAACGAARDESIVAYLDAYEPPRAVFDWGAAGAATAVPFDLVMWRCAAAAACRRAHQPAKAAKHLRRALTDVYPAWSHRGIETRLAAGNEDRVYAMYCRDRARAALNALRRDGVRPSPAAEHLASYAAVMLKTAALLGVDSARSDAEALGALSTAYTLRGLRERDDGDRVGHAIGALRVAVDMADLSSQGGGSGDAHAAVALAELEQRNCILQESIVAPDAHSIIVPRTLGGGAAVSA